MKKLKILFTTDLTEKLLFSLMMIFLFRVLSHIPVPFCDINSIAIIGKTDILYLMNLFSGGSLGNFTLMATGISAYISASIIIQMLSYFIPAVHMLVRSPGGEKKVKKATIILGIICAIVSSLVTTKSFNELYSILTNNKWYVYLIIATCHALGTGIAIWIGESITEKGIGNGMSLLICINVLTSVPSIIQSITYAKLDIFVIIIIVIFVVLIILSTIIAETSERKIPLFYPKAIARGQYPKNAMFFPIKLNISGVMPIVLASYIMQFLSILGNMKNKVGLFIRDILEPNSILYIIVFTLLIFALTFFYSYISFDAREISDNLKKNGAIIPNVKPGKETSDYIEKARGQILRISSIYLSLIYFLPTLVLTLLSANYITATSLIILVGVSIETCKTLKVEIELRDYKTL